MASPLGALSQLESQTYDIGLGIKALWIQISALPLNVYEVCCPSLTLPLYVENVDKNSLG